MFVKGGLATKAEREQAEKEQVEKGQAEIAPQSRFNQAELHFENCRTLDNWDNSVDFHITDEVPGNISMISAVQQTVRQTIIQAAAKRTVSNRT